MKWIEFAVYTTDGGLEPVYGALAQAGLEQVSIEESDDRVQAHLNTFAPYWDYADFKALAAQNGPCVKAYIADLPENQAMLCGARDAVARLKSMHTGIDMGELCIVETSVDEQDWANNWKQYYKPMPIGERLLVCPSWERALLTREQTAGRKVVCLDPGMVFGTGGHDTTRMCLELLEETARKDDEVLDIGCGSGILGISALLLGAKQAVFVDIDPVAARVVRENACMNGLDAARHAVHIGDVLNDLELRQEISARYDIVFANIVADVVIALCPIVKGYLKPEGRFICSGIIDERAQEVKAALKQAGFRVMEERYKGEESGPLVQNTGWVAIMACI